MTDSRHLYTYACDYIRSLTGYNEKGTKISRSDASRIRQGIAEALDMSDELLAIHTAEFYLEHEEDITKKSVNEFNKIMEGGKNV